MRVGGDITVPWKMFGRGDLTVFLRAANVGSHKARHRCRIFAERADVDDRIRRIVLHVGDRIEIDVDADRTPFLSSELRRLICQMFIAGRPDGHRQRQTRRAEEHVPDAAFEIVGDQQRHFRQLLHLIDSQRHGCRIAAVDVQAADVEIDNVATGLRKLVAVDIAKRADVPAGHDHLSDFFVEGHRAEGALDPAAL